MTRFDGEEFGNARIEQLASLIDRLEGNRIDVGFAKRFFRAGEWGLCFKEIYYAAVANGAKYGSMEVELESLNQFLSKYKYYANHLGYPLC